MADKISQLTAANTPLDGTELAPIVQFGVTKQCTIQDIVDLANPSLTATQIAFGDGSNLMTSSSALIFNDGTEFHAVISGVGFRSTGQVDVGDYGAFAFGDNLHIDPSTSLAYYDNTAHTGKFGINTGTPSGELEVKSGNNPFLLIDNANTGLFRIGDMNVASAGNNITIDNVNNLAYYNNDGSFGKFGVNTSTPNFELDVFGTFAAGRSSTYSTSGLIGAGANFGYIGDAEGQGNGNAAIVSDADGILKILNNANDIKVGINTSTPSVALDVVGDVVAGKGGSYSSGLFKTDNSAGVVYLGDWNSDQNNTKITVDDLNNSISFSNSSISMLNLSGTGSRAVLADATGLLSAPVSDFTVKQNIQPLDYGLKDLMKLKPVSFEFIEEYKNYGKGKQIGFIAQNVAEVIPEATFTTPSTGKMGYNDKELISLLVNSVQQLKAELDELKQKLNNNE